MYFKNEDISNMNFLDTSQNLIPNKQEEKENINVIDTKKESNGVVNYYSVMW